MAPRPSLPVWEAEFGHKTAVLQIEFRCMHDVGQIVDKARVILATLVARPDDWGLNGFKRIG